VIRFRFSLEFLIISIWLCVLDCFVDTVQYIVQPWVFIMGFFLRMHSVRLRFLWMMGSTQFFWWVIQPDQERLCDARQ